MKETREIQLYPQLSQFLKSRHREFDLIPEARKAQLVELSAYVRDSLTRTGVARCTFICTHNSRRSHLSQIWAKVAADVCGWRGVQTYSGGTEATAMNPRVVDSLRRTGFEIEIDNACSEYPTCAENPLYLVRYSDEADPLRCFSKVYDRPPNPTSDYCAVMTCSSADDACPVVAGCDLRIPIRYEDPKVSDGTPGEAAVYDERSRQICREMLYAMTAR